MKLSPNFTLEELTRTSYPRLQDVPTELQVMNMVYLCAAVLQPLRDELGRPVSITSGYTESASCGRQRIVRARQERLTLAARADEAHQPATTAGQLQL